jgi:benzoylformate decarboxylase
MVTVADAVVASLARMGVRYVFGLPGSTEGPLLDALSRVDTPEYVLGLHENAVVAMADGYARVSGGPGVVSLHTSVGTGNGVSQMMNANVDRSPVMALIGHKDSRIANRDGFCTVEDLSGLLRPYAKWSREVEAAELAVEDLERAARIALTSPRGPVALTLTEDRARARADEVPSGPVAAPVVPDGFQPTHEEVRTLVSTLADARRPVVIAGDGVAGTHAVDLLGAVAERFACPVVQEPRRSAARFNFDTAHATFCGEYELGHPAVKDADLVVAIGARVFVEFEPQVGSELPEGSRLVHLHDNAAELGKRYVPDLTLLGTAAATLREVLRVSDHDAVEPRASASRVRELRDAYLRESKDKRMSTPETSLTVGAASKVLNEVLPEDLVLVDEGIRSSRVLLQYLSLPTSREYHRNTGGAIGWGLPAAVGAAFAAPQRRVALFVGDGSALMSIQALWTAARYELPLTIFVSNNRGYQAVQAAVEKHRESRLGQPAVGAAIDAPAPDFVDLARGFGVAGEAVTSCEHLREAAARATGTLGPYLIELRLVETEHVGRRDS